jgi:Uma2 family endonuclease
MAIAPTKILPPLLTYEAYLEEGEVLQRYDIIDGVRESMPNPSRHHQRLLFKIGRLFSHYEETSGQGQVIIAPCDVLITRIPLRTRQPDVLFISKDRLAQNPSEDDPAPLNPAPELVVEILSPSETWRIHARKIADYCKVNVLECWAVSPDTQSVEVLRLAPQGAQSEAVYRMGETVVSLTFPDLAVPVAEIFSV